MGIGQRIKDVSKEKGMTLKEVADRSGISYNTIYSITKRDSERIQGSILQRISSALEVSPSQLIGTVSENFDDIMESILGEYPKAAFASGEERDSFRLTLGAGLRSDLIRYFDNLNIVGQHIAIERVKELAKIPDYQREKTSTQPTQDPPDDKK